MNLCMAHRGWSGAAPENTMAAIKQVLTEPRIQAIEIDVQLSKDGVPVIIHDFTLERTTTGKGYVKDHTYEELHELDAGSWFEEKFSAEKIPTFEEVLVEVQGKCRLNIELKTAGGMYPDIERKVLDLLNQYQMKSEVMITSFDHEVIKQLHQLDPTFTTGLIVYGKPTLIREQLKETGATILSIAYSYLTPEFVTSIINEGIQVVAWTIDDRKDIETIMGYHPQIQICTNYPDRMIKLIG